MSSDTSSGDATVLGPDSAFGVLGHELRIEIVKRLGRAGERIVEAVLSGAVTDDPVLSRTEIDQSCPYCGAPVEVEYGQEQLTLQPAARRSGACCRQRTRGQA